jgi:hypothetical protein
MLPIGESPVTLRPDDSGPDSFASLLRSPLPAAGEQGTQRKDQGEGYTPRYTGFM